MFKKMRVELSKTLTTSKITDNYNTNRGDNKRIIMKLSLKYTKYSNISDM